MAVKTVIVAAILTLSLAACSSGKRYELRGQIVAVNADRQEITVKHDDIKGFMPAMTMPFKVHDKEMLKGREPGDIISATLVVGTREVHLERIRRTGFAVVPDDTSAGARYDLLEPGEPVPDEPFVDQDGRPRRLADWREKTLAVTFIYTRCPLPDFCPLMDRHFAHVQTQIMKDPALKDRVHLLSVTFDPAHDTPAVLSAHARRAGADRRSWSFLTGEAPAIDRFASRFGVSVMREGAPAKEIVHNLRTAVIDRDGRLVRVFNGTDWTPIDLAAELRQAVERR